MSPPLDTSLSITRAIAAPPQDAFDAWTTPEQMVKWACPDPTAPVVVDADVRPGGAFEIRMDVGGGSVTAFGTYREVERPNRVVYTWDWREEAQAMKTDTVVTVEFGETDGGCDVWVRQDGFPTRDARDGHTVGWGLCLDRFERLFL